ncbi:MAG: hypothetical protein V3V08_21845 [Nannocystaceae bacterium]
MITHAPHLSHHLHRLRHLPVVALLMLAPACTGGGTDSSSNEHVEASSAAPATESPENLDPHATLLGEVDLERACAIDSAEKVTFLARLVACVNLSSPCTIPTSPHLELRGDTVTCPATGTQSMATQVTRDGRYQAEVQVALTGGDHTGWCFGLTNADPQVLVEKSALEDRADIDTNWLYDTTCTPP